MSPKAAETPGRGGLHPHSLRRIRRRRVVERGRAAVSESADDAIFEMQVPPGTRGELNDRLVSLGHAALLH